MVKTRVAAEMNSWPVQTQISQRLHGTGVLLLAHQHAELRCGHDKHYLQTSAVLPPSKPSNFHLKHYQFLPLSVNEIAKNPKLK